MTLKNKIKSVFGRLFPVSYSKFLFRIRQGYKLNLKDPKDFNEKLMWLKLNLYFKDENVLKLYLKFWILCKLMIICTYKLHSSIY